jgi:hypothetical protein
MMRYRYAPFLLSAAASFAAGCGDSDPVDARPPRQTVVAVDLSGSQTQQSLQDSREFVGKLIDQLSYGDQFVLIEMSRSGVHGEMKRMVDSVPALADPTFVSSVDEDNLDGTKEAMRSLVPILFDSTLVGRILQTDIFATLHTVSEYVRDKGGRPTTLVLLSDMLQSANGIEMEQLRRMPGPQWIAQQKSRGTLPDLAGVCVVVVGADDSTPEGVEVKRFWVEYMKAAGADLRDSNYRLLATGVGDVSCGAGSTGGTAVGQSAHRASPP